MRYTTVKMNNTIDLKDGSTITRRRLKMHVDGNRECFATYWIIVACAVGCFILYTSYRGMIMDKSIDKQNEFMFRMWLLYAMSVALVITAFVMTLGATCCHPAAQLVKLNVLFTKPLTYAELEAELKKSA